MINMTLQAGFLNSLMTAGADLEVPYNELAPHANERLTAALELATHAKQVERWCTEQVAFGWLSASQDG
jgi:hypothetical protein